MSNIAPAIHVLTEDQKRQIHNRSIDILTKVGIRVDSDRARKLFCKAIGMSDDPYVRIPSELVDWAIKVAPSDVLIYDRDGVQSFSIGQDIPRFGIGVTALYAQDPGTDQVSPFCRNHMREISRLANTLSSFDVISTIGIIQDVPPSESDLYAILEMMANSKKALVILVSDDAQFLNTLALAEHLHGDLSSFPFLIPYVNPITPLVLNKGTIEKMYGSIERGIPFIFSNYGMAGATTPIDPAGVLALMNAELLAGLTLSQLIKEGTPVILGNLPGYFDMRGMSNYYEPLSYLLNLACGEMMRHYSLPHAGTSGSGMGWGSDLIACGHQWFNHLTSCMGCIGLAPFVGDNLGSKAFSPTVIVLANEIIAQARRFATGFEWSNSPYSLDEMIQVGPGGSFLTCKSTLDNLRTGYYQNEIFPNWTLERWEQEGHPSALSFLRQRTRSQLENATPPPDFDSIIQKGQTWISNCMH